jgi:hypothetical protein
MERVQIGMIFARLGSFRAFLMRPDVNFAGQMLLGNSSALTKGDILCMKTPQPRF